MKLKTKIYLLSALLILVTGGMAIWVARDQALNIVTDWALRYAEKQVLYDKVRMMQPYKSFNPRPPLLAGETVM